MFLNDPRWRRALLRLNDDVLLNDRFVFLLPAPGLFLFTAALWPLVSASCTYKRSLSKASDDIWECHYRNWDSVVGPLRENNAQRVIRCLSAFPTSFVCTPRVASYRFCLSPESSFSSLPLVGRQQGKETPWRSNPLPSAFHLRG